MTVINLLSSLALTKKGEKHKSGVWLVESQGAILPKSLKKLPVLAKKERSN
jgi:hypothetical protein